MEIEQVDETPKPEDRGLHTDVDSARYSPFWHSIKDLYDCSWFWRMWYVLAVLIHFMTLISIRVIQEAVLAPTAVVKWGHAEIAWHWIGLAAAILRTNYHKICEKLKLRGVYNAYLMFRMSRMSDLPPIELDFIQLLRITRQFEVSDTRDRVIWSAGYSMY
jgi:hypothetical protein